MSDETPAGDETSPTASAPRSDSGWRRLARMGKPRLTKANIMVTVLAVGLGFAIQTQVHSNRASGLENLRQDDLVALLDGVNSRALKLDGDVATLRRQKESLNAPGGDDAAVKAAEQRRTTLGILAGTVPATGPGITMTIADPQHGVSTSALVDAVEELRDAGAEAIQFNDVRVVASTWIEVGDDGVVRADGKALKAPFVITAIGDPHTMSTAMAIPGGVEENLRQLGASATVTQSQSLKVTALRPSAKPQYAHPDDAAK